MALWSFRRLAPVAYRRSTAGIHPLTFHYMFPADRENGERIFRALKREGDFISTLEMRELLTSRQKIRHRLFHLSVDDGFRNVLDNALPILKGLQIPFTFFVCPAVVTAAPDGLQAFYDHTGYAGFLPVSTWEMLAEAAAAGVEIGSHTLSHRRLADLSAADIRTEVFDSRAEIERRIGKPCISFAWPFGRAGSITRDGLRICREAGYEFIFSSMRGTVRGPDDVFPYLPRHHFEPDWPVDTVIYYATRDEGHFMRPPDHRDLLEYAGHQRPGNGVQR
jgi:peptidoglycan/xylan/chitin deacetylase (PgdA/CDA1 family)